MCWSFRPEDVREVDLKSDCSIPLEVSFDVA
jgi:hypothetical protein